MIESILTTIGDWDPNGDWRVTCSGSGSPTLYTAELARDSPDDDFNCTVFFTVTSRRFPDALMNLCDVVRTFVAAEIGEEFVTRDQGSATLAEHPPEPTV